MKEKRKLIQPLPKAETSVAKKKGCGCGKRKKSAANKHK